MSHAIESAVFNQPAWHKLGIQLGRNFTGDEALKYGELDWNVRLAGIMALGSADHGSLCINTHNAVVRFGAAIDPSVLGVVGENYVPIQNKEVKELADAIIGEGQAVYNAAGSLYNGKKVFFVLQMAPGYLEGHDQIDKYLLVCSSHDGSMSLQIRFTPVRVVCANTLAVALKGFAASSYTVRHVGNWKEKVAEAREALNLSGCYFRYMEQQFNKMIMEEYTKDKMAELTKQLLPAELDDQGDELISSSLSDRRDTLINLYDSAIGVENYKDTRWAAFNAVTEFADHHSNFRTDSSRMESVLWGNAASMKNKAFSLLSA